MNPDIVKDNSIYVAVQVVELGDHYVVLYFEPSEGSHAFYGKILRLRSHCPQLWRALFNFSDKKTYTFEPSIELNHESLQFGLNIGQLWGLSRLPMSVEVVERII